MAAPLATTLASAASAAAASFAASGARAASGVRAVIRSASGLPGAAAAISFGTTASLREVKRAIASAAETDSHVSGDSSAASITANDSSSS